MIQIPDMATLSDLLTCELAKAILLQDSGTGKQTLVRQQDWQV
jgi:hypothetical protein